MIAVAYEDDSFIYYYLFTKNYRYGFKIHV